MVLAVEINLVTLGLELFADQSEVLELYHEVRNIVDRALQVTNRLIKPLKYDHGAFFSNLGHKDLNLIQKGFGCRSQILLDLFGVEMKETDVRHARQLSLEVVVLPLEQSQSVLKRIDRVFEVNISEDINIELLVAPVDLEKGLEARHESISLGVGTIDECLHLLLVRLLHFVLENPRSRLEGDCL